MNRTSSQVTVLAFALFLFSLCTTVSFGKTTCNQMPQGRHCISEVPLNKFAAAYAPQQMDEWCWAASISMVFAYYGHKVNQATIVQSVYGAPGDWPSRNGVTISYKLNQDWVDAAGKKFSARLTSAYDYLAHFNNMTNQWIVSELDKEHPLVIASGTHAMVATAVEYFDQPAGPYIVNVGVVDPWPGRGARNLTGCDIVAADVVCGPGPYGPVRGQLVYAASVDVN